MKAQVRSKVDCTTEVELNGNVSGRVGLSHLDLCEENVRRPNPSESVNRASPDEQDGADVSTDAVSEAL